MKFSEVVGNKCVILATLLVFLSCSSCSESSFSGNDKAFGVKNKSSGSTDNSEIDLTNKPDGSKIADSTEPSDIDAANGSDGKIDDSTPTTLDAKSTCVLLPGPVRDIGTEDEFYDQVKLGGNFRLTANIILSSNRETLSPSEPVNISGENFKLTFKPPLFSKVSGCFEKLSLSPTLLEGQKALFALDFNGRFLNSTVPSHLIDNISGPSEFAGLILKSTYVFTPSGSAWGGLAREVNGVTEVRNSNFTYNVSMNTDSFKAGGLFLSVNSPTIVRDSTFTIRGLVNTGNFELGGITFQNKARLEIRGVEVNINCQSNTGHFSCAGLVFNADAEVVIDGFKVTSNFGEAFNRVNTTAYAGAIFKGQGPTSLSNGKIIQGENYLRCSNNYGGIYNVAQSASVNSVHVEFDLGFATTSATKSCECSKGFYNVKKENVVVTDSTCTKVSYDAPEKN